MGNKISQSEIKQMRARVFKPELETNTCKGLDAVRLLAVNQREIYASKAANDGSRAGRRQAERRRDYAKVMLTEIDNKRRLANCEQKAISAAEQALLDFENAQLKADLGLVNQATEDIYSSVGASSGIERQKILIIGGAILTLISIGLLIRMSKK